MYNLLPFIFIFGLIIGSFLNVVIYRLHTGKSLNGDSHCLSCGHYLTWYELVPLFSYLVLLGRCRVCQSYIPKRYFLVELLTALLFTLVYLVSDGLIVLLIQLVLASLLMVILVYDLYHMIIPDEYTIAIGVCAVFLVGLSHLEGIRWEELGFSLAASFLSFIFFASLWWYSKGTWLGFGDAKLAAPLGFLVGWPGFFSMLIFSFWIGALISLVILALQKTLRRGQLDLRILGQQLTMKSEVPFAPFLIAAFILVYFLGADVMVLISNVLV